MMYMNYTEAQARLAEMKIEHSADTVLAPYTTFRIGGAAKLAVFPKTADEAVAALALLHKAGIPIAVLGNGSNLLVSDEGFDGAAVILTGMRSFSVSGDEISVGAGMPLTKLAIEASKHSLTGLEFAYGIPGTVGGAIYMNAGAYGGQMSDVVIESEYFDIATGVRGTVQTDAHCFAYRHSIYEDGDKVILSAKLKLAVGNKSDIDGKMSELMSKRRDKQPLEYPSAGSTFKRGNGFITAQVIDEAGLKGLTVGGAQVSEKHAGFIINKGGATAADVMALVELVKEAIRSKYGYELECEIIFLK